MTIFYISNPTQYLNLKTALWTIHKQQIKNGVVMKTLKYNVNKNLLKGYSTPKWKCCH